MRKGDASLHRSIADLLERGADPVHSYNNVYEQGTANRIQLLGLALATLRTAHDGRVAHMTVTRDMFSRTGTNEEDTDNFINYTLAIADVQVGLMFTEPSEGIKVSFRSRGEIEINKLAQEFGGNGHKNDAGARIASGSIDADLPRVLERVPDYLI